MRAGLSPSVGIFIKYFFKKWKMYKSPPKSARSVAFWDIDFTANERVVMLMALVMCLIMHLSPILNAGLAEPLVLALGLVCFRYPVTGFFFIGASAVLPMTSGEAYQMVREMKAIGLQAETIDSGTKYAFIAWAVVVAFHYRRVNLRGISLLLPLAPLLCWLIALFGPLYLLNDVDLWKNIAYCVMACQLVNVSRGKYLKNVMGLAIGLLVASFGFWGKAVGLPVQLSTWGGERGGFERLGSVGLDSVMLWPALLVGISILLGILASFGSRFAIRQPPKWFSKMVIAAFVMSIPPLVGTMTNSAYIGFALIIIVFVLAVKYASGTSIFLRKSKNSLVKTVSIIAIMLVVLFATNAMQLQDRAMAYMGFYSELSHQDGAMGSRTDVWVAAWDTILRYPLLGVYYNGGTETIPVGYAERLGWYMTHNMFLEYGRQAGIPGMFLYAFFFFWPVFILLRRKNYFPYLAFLMGHFALFIFLMSLSFGSYKPLWAFWMLMAITANDSQPFRILRKKVGVSNGAMTIVAPLESTSLSRSEAPPAGNTKHGNEIEATE